MPLAGRICLTDRPESEWVRVSPPQLRIVPDALWQQAHAKLAAARLRTNVQASRARESKYLLRELLDGSLLMTPILRATDGGSSSLGASPAVRYWPEICAVMEIQAVRGRQLEVRSAK